MTRIAIILTVVCALSGAVLNQLYERNRCKGSTNVEDSAERNLTGKSLKMPVVRAVHDIASFTTIKADDLENKTVDAAEYSKGTVTEIWMAAGKIAAHKIKKGQLINNSDLESVCGPVFRAAKVIPKGKIITSSDVSEYLSVYVRPKDALLSRGALVIGKRAKRLIGKEKVITVQDVELP